MAGWSDWIVPQPSPGGPFYSGQLSFAWRGDSDPRPQADPATPEMKQQALDRVNGSEAKWGAGFPEPGLFERTLGTVRTTGASTSYRMTPGGRTGIPTTQRQVEIVNQGIQGGSEFTAETLNQAVRPKYPVELEYGQYASDWGTGPNGERFEWENSAPPSWVGWAPLTVDLALTYSMDLSFPVLPARPITVVARRIGYNQLQTPPENVRLFHTDGAVASWTVTPGETTATTFLGSFTIDPGPALSYAWAIDMDLWAPDSAFIDKGLVETRLLNVFGGGALVRHSRFRYWSNDAGGGRAVPAPLRVRQRGDGLGTSVRRVKSPGSRQASPRVRGYL